MKKARAKLPPRPGQKLRAELMARPRPPSPATEAKRRILAEAEAEAKKYEVKQ